MSPYFHLCNLYLNECVIYIWINNPFTSKWHIHNIVTWKISSIKFFETREKLITFVTFNLFQTKLCFYRATLVFILSCVSTFIFSLLLALFWSSPTLEKNILFLAAKCSLHSQDANFPSLAAGNKIDERGDTENQNNCLKDTKRLWIAKGNYRFEADFLWVQHYEQPLPHETQSFDPLFHCFL